jgi:hypothetical protein
MLGQVSHPFLIYENFLELYLSMKKKALFNIKKSDPELVSDVASTSKLPAGGKDSSEFQGKLYAPLDDDDINHANRHVIELKKEAGYEDAFFIQIIDKDILNDILFVHTSVGILKKSIPFLCLGSDSIPKERFN